MAAVAQLTILQTMASAGGRSYAVIVNSGDGVHSVLDCSSSSLYVIGHTRLLYLHKWCDSTRPIKIVDMPPPMKPSHVFFGDNLISGVLPKKKPNR